MKSEPVGQLVRVFYQLWGKTHRFAINRFRPRHVRTALSKRHGECERCGACCKILFKCPFLDRDEDGLAICKIYDKRPINCRLFPLNERDIKERDMVPGIKLPCGYRFEAAEAQAVETRSGEAAD